MNEQAPFRRVDPSLSFQPEDERLLEAYDGFDDKGAPAHGYRITLMSATTRVGVGDIIRVLHVCESVSDDAPLYVMGPKPVRGEWVDDVLSGDAPPTSHNPFEPASYDGRVKQGPGVDANYEVTRYRFDEPGVHTIQWRIGNAVSNALRFIVS